jgi:N-acetyl-alpha-D-glucosaminyl L-malate synthase BshA
VVCFPSLGGSGVVAAELASGLAERGHRVHVLASALPGRLRESPRLRFERVAVPGYPLFEHAPYALAVASALVDLARREPLDLLHVHYAVPHAASATLARQALGAAAPRLVVSLHGTDVTRVGADPAYRSITAFTVGAADGIVTPSDALRQAARDTLGVTAPVEIIPNFVDSARFAPPALRDRRRLAACFPTPAPDGPVLFHVSNFRPVKRVGDLLDVLARLRRDRPARLVLVGDGPDRPALEARALSMGLGDHVAFLGRRADFVDDLRHADAFVLPSESESFGVAALEALAAGVPVFGYRVGGLPEVVTDDVGRLVAPFDVDALADAIGAAVATPEARDALGHAGRERVLAHFRREPALDRYEAYFRRICAPAPATEHP